MPIALPIDTNMSVEEVAEFSDYFHKVMVCIKDVYHIDITERFLEAGLNYYAHEFTPKLLKCSRFHNVQRGVLLMLSICNDILYVENLYKYCKDRHKVDLMEHKYEEAINARLQEFHTELRAISSNQGSYEDGYQAVMRLVREYMIQKPAEGSA